MTCDICISCDFSNSGLCFRCIVRYMLYYDLPCTYYGVCTICWLCDTSSCHCEDSFMFVKKKKKGSSHICFKKTLCKNQNSEVQVLCISPDDVVFCPDTHLSSIIRSDDENFSSGLQSVSRSFELFQVASVRTFQQHVWTPGLHRYIGR
jgi:hypothetical protein